MRTRDRFFRVFRLFLVGTSFLGYGCAPQEILQQGSDAADQTVFNRPAASKLWDPDAAPELKLKDVTDYIQSILVRVAEHAKTPGGYSVTIKDDSIVNGSSGLGDIILTRGMLNACQNEAEIAAYIGHEIGHQDARGEELEKSARRGMISSLISRGVGYASNAYGVDTSVAQKQASDIADARHSQEAEENADHYGAELAAKAGYDPYALADLFDWLSSRVTKDAGYRIAKLKGTHKALDVRSTRLRNYLASKGYKHEGELAAERYQSSLASLLTYGVPSRARMSAAEKLQSAKLDDVAAEIKRYQSSGKSVPVIRFVAMMRILSDIRRANAPVISFRGGNGFRAFMEEFLYQAMPAWGDGNLGAPFSRANSLINNLGQMNVGLGRGLPGSTDLFSLLTGTSFDSGLALAESSLESLAQNVLSAAGSAWHTAGDAIDAGLQALESAGSIAASTVTNGIQAVSDVMTRLAENPPVPQGDQIPSAIPQTAPGDIPRQVPTQNPGDTIPNQTPTPQGDTIPSNDDPGYSTATPNQGVTMNPDGSAQIHVRFKEDWTDAQKTEAREKIAALNQRGDLKVVDEVKRSQTSASARYKKAGNTVPEGRDVDHQKDLQLGGDDTIDNMWHLDSSVNRSLGIQIHHRINGLQPGTSITEVILDES